MSEWQPIKTAPKDGTLVLLWGHELGYRSDDRITIGKFTGIYHWFSIGGEEATGWESIESEMDGHPEEGYSEFPKKVAPSHWMPLPDPPAEFIPVLGTRTP